MSSLYATSAAEVLEQRVLLAATVVDQHLFYNNSKFDADGPSSDPAENINADDDLAIANNKDALLPGAVASFANYSSYSRGINGIMVDIADAAGTLTLADFEFAVGNGADLNIWTAAPAPMDFDVRDNAGTSGSDRVTITWADNEIENEWLQVTVLANANTDLDVPHVHYWGNQIGETGNDGTTAVNGSDRLAILANPTGFTPATVTNDFDINRDSAVNGSDRLLVLANPTGFTSLALFQPSIPPVLDPITNQVVEVGDQVTFTATASDGDVPETLSFSLDPGAPATATIDPLTGIFNWVPVASDGGTTHQVTVRVTDSMGASASQVVDIQVNETQQTGLFYNLPGTSDDYTLFSPNFTFPSGDPATSTTGTYLIDKNGNVINEWQAQLSPGLHAYLLPDGSLIRPATEAAPGTPGNAFINANGGGGLIERYDWDGNLIWTFDYNNDDTLETAVWQHHDIEVMPNGNILMIAWETMTAAEAEQAGRDDTLLGGGQTLFPEHIIEVEPDLVAGVGGNIVWEWHVTDHLVQQHDATKDNYFGPTGVADNPQLVDINYISAGQPGGDSATDWIHFNGIDYNPVLDQIVVSSREYSEFWIIDHSTTTAEAAGSTGGNSGKGGDLLYRFGNPQAHDAGVPGDQFLFFQHDPKWIEPGQPGAGNITVFNNGDGGPGVSEVHEITTTVDGSGNYPLPASGTPHAATIVDTYTADVDDFSQIISGTQRLDNGNWLITYGGDGTFVEVTPSGEEVWRYTSPYIPGAVLGENDPTTSIGFGDLDNNFVFRATNYDPTFFQPILASIGDQEIAIGSELSFTATATAAGFVGQNLAFSLDGGAPAGANIDGSSGLFTWTPPLADGLGPVDITIRVTDAFGETDFETITVDVIPAVGVAFSAEELDFVHRSLEFDGDGGSGAVWFDYNNDHHMDLFLPNGRTQTSVLYENQGDGTFVDVTVAAGLTSTVGGAAVVAGDIDNDGNVDLLVTGDGGMINDVPPAFRVYRNLGNGTFSDITATSGITEPDGSGSVALADVNNDGFLDVFISAFGSFAPTPTQTASKLYLNDGDLTFTDVTVASGIGPHLGACVAGFSDYDMDGDVDLFISNCNDVTFAPTPIQLFQNDGSGNFTDVTVAAGLSTELGFWMATSFADYDNDGDIDLFATNSGDAPGPHGGRPHGLFQNQGNGTFVNVAVAAGVSAWEFGWGAAFDDLDNDGVVDLMFTGSLPPAPFNVVGPGIGNPGRLFFGNGAGAFTEASVNLGIDQSNDYTTGVAYGDYNKDGFQDIVITTEKWEPTRTGKPVLLTNQGNDNHWLGVELVGTTSNRDAVGAKVTLKYGDTENLTQVKEIYAGTSFASMDSQSLRFGLGQNLNATTVQVDWPSGLVESFHIWQGIDQVVKLTEGDGTPLGTVFLDPIFDVQVTNDLVYRHDAPVNQGPITEIPLELDLYEPVGLGLPAELPAAILIHGGGFTGGDKAQQNFVDLAHDFASRGYVTVSIDYRLTGDVPPAANNTAPPGVDPLLYNAIIAGIEDTFYAIDWLKDSADELNVDTSRIVLGGHSAGAYLSLYAGMLDDTELTNPPLVPNPLLDTPGLTISELGVAGILDLAGAIEGLEYAIDAADPPVFIGHSTDDTVVPIALANALETELIADGITYEFPVITGVGHGLDGKLDFVIGNETVRDQIFDFFDQELTLQTLPQRTTGLFYNKVGASDDYTLFSPNQTGDTYLINKEGEILNHWQSQYPPGLHAYLLPDGSLIRTAAAETTNAHITATGGGGLIERFDWNGNLVWTYDYNHDATFETAVWQHHDIEVMPNGNILMIAWETLSAADAEQAGRDDSLPGGGGNFFPDHIVEVQPDLVAGVGGTIVWEWHATDHLVQDHDPTKDNWYGTNGVSEHPELININYFGDQANGGGPPNDWLHANGIDYNADLDQIVISLREFSEFWIIDHSTTTAEAAGHTGGNSGKGGDLLYRWGNPQAYNAGDESDRQLFFQHDPKWVETGHPGAGNITVLNNGFGGPERTSIVEIQTTVDGSGNYVLPAPGDAHAPTTPAFSYTAPFADYSQIISGTQRLDNGNTLLTYGGDGTFVEVTPNGEEVWRYTNPYTGAGILGPSDPIPGPIFVDLNTNFVFRATNYDPGFFNAGLIPENPTALDLYVAAPDDSYQYSFDSSFTGTHEGTGYTAYVLDMDSQTWMDASVVATPTWQHWVTMIVPDGVTSDTAILHIDSGSQSATAPTSADSYALQRAIDTGMIVINLPTVPNQPQQFFSDGVNRFEDNIIAYTFDKYLETGDDSWPLLLPMVKSAVAAMDTAQNYAGTMPFDIDDFIVTGASKRGWTTWLTAAVDNRVKAIAPLVIDVLNMGLQMPHHFEHYSKGSVTPATLVGGYSAAIQDYVNFNIIQRLDDPGAAELRDIVDPYEYRDRLTIPKYLINGTGDEFFVPDSGQFYLDDLQGPTYVRYVPNAGHGLNADAADGAGSFFAAIDAGAALPTYSWALELNGERIRLNTVDSPVEVRMWQATNPTSLDFRYGYEPATRPVWTSTVLTETSPSSGEYVAQVTPPVSGGTGFYIEMTYNVGGETMKFTTEISIVEPAPPPAAPTSAPVVTELSQETSPVATSAALVESAPAPVTRFATPVVESFAVPQTGDVTQPAVAEESEQDAPAPVEQDTDDPQRESRQQGFLRKLRRKIVNAVRRFANNIRDLYETHPNKASALEQVREVVEDVKDSVPEFSSLDAYFNEEDQARLKINLERKIGDRLVRKLSRRRR